MFKKCVYLCIAVRQVPPSWIPRWRKMPDEAEISVKTKIYTFFLTFFNAFNILTPKLCVQRIAKTENVQKLPKLV